MLAGALWTYGAQLVTIVVQFFYAAATSRSVNDVGFGEYSVALSASAIVGLLANGGLGQTVARMQVIRRDVMRSLLTFSILLGLGAAAVLWICAGFWSEVWGSPGAKGAIRWSALGALVAPVLGLTSGLMRREGLFGPLALATLSTNIAGFGVGSIAVMSLHSGESLLVSPLFAEGALAGVALFLSRKYLGRPSSLRAAWPFLGFSWQVTAQNLGAWFAGNLGGFAMSRYFSAALLGQWNRADVVTTVPFQQLQTAMVQAVYPEFRHDIEGPSRAARVWPDLLGLVSWIVLPIASALAVLSAFLIPVLFGPGWEIAARMAPLLAVIGGVRSLRVLLGAGVEALGRYRWVWFGISVDFVLTGLGAVVGILMGEYWVILIGVAMGVVGAHVANCLSCAFSGYMSLKVLSRHYFGAFAMSAVVGLVVWILVDVLYSAVSLFWYVTIVVLVIAVFGIVLGLFWGRIPPVRLARKYGLLPERRP